MIVRELLTRLGFTADNDAVRRHERALIQVTRAARGAALAATAVRVAAGTMVVGLAQNAREIERLATLGNTNADEFQRFAAGADVFGVSMEKSGDILKDVNDKVGDFLATGGGPLIDFFEKIAPKVGVTAEQFEGLSGAQGLGLYVAALEDAKLSQAEMTFYMEALANDSTLLLPLLRKNGEALDDIADRAERYGAILSDDVVKSSAEFSKNLGVIGLMVKGLRYEIGAQLLPRMNEMISRFIAWYDANGDIVRQNIAGVLTAITDAMTAVISAITTVAPIITRVVESMGGWETVTRLVISALVALTAQKVIQSLFALARGIRAAGGAFAFMGAAVKKIPGVLALVAFAAVLEDLWAWVNGSESAIGKLLGSWEDFSAKWGPMFEKIGKVVAVVFDGIGRVISSVWGNVISPIFDKIGAGISRITDAFGAIAKLRDRFRGRGEVDGNAFNTGVVTDPLSEVPGMTNNLPMGSGGTTNHNQFNVPVTVTVPAGTSDEQAAFLQQTATDSMSSALEQATRDYLANNPRGE